MWSKPLEGRKNKESCSHWRLCNVFFYISLVIIILSTFEFYNSNMILLFPLFVFCLAPLCQVGIDSLCGASEQLRIEIYFYIHYLQIKWSKYTSYNCDFGYICIYSFIQNMSISLFPNTLLLTHCHDCYEQHAVFFVFNVAILTYNLFHQIQRHYMHSNTKYVEPRLFLSNRWNTTICTPTNGRFAGWSNRI